MKKTSKIIITALIPLLINFKANALPNYDHIPNIKYDKSLHYARYNEVIGNFNKAINLYKESKTIISKYYLAELYDNLGKNDKSKNIYFELNERIANKQLDNNEKLFLAELYYDGDKSAGIKKDPKKAFDIFLNFAQSGNPYAQNRLSYIYNSRFQNIVEVDKEKSLFWANKAYEGFLMMANNGNLEAHIEISEMFHYTHQAFERDPRKSYEWLKKAADRNYLPAILKMSEYYGIHYDLIDREKENKYAKLAADNGSAKGMELYASALARKPEKSSDYSLAKKYALKSIELGYIWGIQPYLLASTSEDENDSYEYFGEYIRKHCNLENGIESINWYCFDLPRGIFYEKGYEVPKDIKKAIEEYEDETKYNSYFAGFSAYRLGVIYENGIGVLKDYRKAIDFYEQAIKYDYQKAKCNIIKPLVETGDILKAKEYAKDGYRYDFKKCEKLWNEFELYKI